MSTFHAHFPCVPCVFPCTPVHSNSLTNSTDSLVCLRMALGPNSFRFCLCLKTRVAHLSDIVSSTRVFHIINSALCCSTVARHSNLYRSWKRSTPSSVQAQASSSPQSYEDDAICLEHRSRGDAIVMPTRTMASGSTKTAYQRRAHRRKLRQGKARERPGSDNTACTG